MSTHTPGPWTLETKSSYKYGAFVKAERKIIAGVGGMNFTPDTNLANARLISAAPDLLIALETLTEMVADGDWTTVELNEARAAIAKAKGGGA